MIASENMSSMANRQREESVMKGAAAVAEILKREGTEILIGYPVNPIIEAAAVADIRTIIIRQERTGLHMADGFSRVSSGKRVGVFAMQHGPGTENAFGGVAQAYGDSVPIVVFPGGYPRRLTNIPPNFNAFLNFRHISKWIEQVPFADVIPDALRRAFTQVRNGRPRPVVVEIPTDVFQEDVPEPLDYKPVVVTRSAPDPSGGAARWRRCWWTRNARCIYAGQGVHYAQAWPELRELAELLAAPVTTSLEGKSAFPETHPLSLGSGGRSIPKTVHDFLQNSDVIFGIGCSFAVTNYGVSMPSGKVIIHATLDPADLNKDVPAEYALIGDAKLTLQALIGEVKDRLGASMRDGHQVAAQIKQIKDEWTGAVAAETDRQRRAPVALSRHLGPHAYGGYRQYHHHPRCRQPTGSALAILAACRAAHLHRLGQDHAARLRPGTGHGGQTGRA